jgi:hypothetical protein
MGLEEQTCAIFGLNSREAGVRLCGGGRRSSPNLLGRRTLGAPLRFGIGHAVEGLRTEMVREYTCPVGQKAAIVKFMATGEASCTATVSDSRVGSCRSHAAGSVDCGGQNGLSGDVSACEAGEWPVVCQRASAFCPLWRHQTS